MTSLCGAMREVEGGGERRERGDSEFQYISPDEL